jgi:hypothetical protein
MPTSLQPLGALLAPEQPAKRPTLTGNYERPRLSERARQNWIRSVARLISKARQDKESFPRTVGSVAIALANIGDECFMELETIAHMAGCVRNTAKACIDWLESKGALTWSHTARRHSSGNWVRSSNLYTLIPNFAGLIGLLARARRAMWRERRSGNTKSCAGLNQQRLFVAADSCEARKRLREIGEIRGEILERERQEQRLRFAAT